jgi:endonuclease/exonuclease/phosphatase family metal-dependent hydrolase
MTRAGRVHVYTIAAGIVLVCVAWRVQTQSFRDDKLLALSQGTVTQAGARPPTTPSRGNLFSTDQDMELHILTYNTQFRDTAADVFAPRWPNTKRRARAIGRAIACYDLIALQEEFRDDRRAQVVSTAQSAGASCAKPTRFASGLPFTVVTGPTATAVASSSLFTTVKRVTEGFYDLVLGALGQSVHAIPVTGSGLLLLSRYPVRQVNFHTFHHKAGFDAWAQKGVLHAVVCRDTTSEETDCLDVFVTHLQAGATRQAQRRGQVNELAQFIRTVRATAPNRPALVMGDFNINSQPDEWNPSASQYSALREALTAADPRLADLWITQAMTGPGYTDRRRHKRIDYIFATTGPKFTALSVKVNELPVAPSVTQQWQPVDLATSVPPLAIAPRFLFLSDHAGVEAHVRWRQLDAPAEHTATQEH